MIFTNDTSRDWASLVRGYDEIEAKFEAEEERLKSDLAGLGWWRIFRRSMIQARLQGINRGLLELTFRRIYAQNGIAPPASGGADD